MIRKYLAPTAKSEFQVGAGVWKTWGSVGTSCRKQPFTDSVEIFPSCFGQCRISSDDIADHLPRGQIQRALWRRSHGQRYGALRAEGNPLSRRFLARTNSDSLREQIHGNRLFSGFELAITAQTIRIFQDADSAWWLIYFDRTFFSLRYRNTLHLLSPMRRSISKYAEGFLGSAFCRVIDEGRQSCKGDPGTKLWSSQRVGKSRTLLPWLPEFRRDA